MPDTSMAMGITGGATGQGALTTDEVLGGLFRFGQTWASDEYLSNRDPGSVRDPAPKAPKPGVDAALPEPGPGPKVSMAGIGASLGAALVVGLLVYFLFGKNAAWALIAAAVAAAVVAWLMAQKG